MSNKEFYVGQEVVCIDANISSLDLLRHYTIKSKSESFLWLEDVDTGYHKNRFEDVKEWAARQVVYGKDWTENKGYCPVEYDVLVDVRINDIHRPVNDGCAAHTWNWAFEDVPGDITHWRLHKAEQPSAEEESFKGLENAYDEPEQEGSPMPAEMFTPAVDYSDVKYVKKLEHKGFKQPETSYKAPDNISVKRSKHSLAAEIYELVTGKCLTEDDVSDIVAVLRLIERMEK